MTAGGAYLKRRLSRLRLVLTVFFLALSIPTALLIRQTWVQLHWESFHHHRVLAAELATRIGARLNQVVDDEDARALADYAFLVTAGESVAKFFQRSPLSVVASRAMAPGLIGHFQIDPEGRLTTPVLPPTKELTLAFGMSSNDLLRRSEIQARIQEVLRRNELLGGPLKEPGANGKGGPKPFGRSGTVPAVGMGASTALLAGRRYPESQNGFDELSRSESQGSERARRMGIAPLASIGSLGLADPYPAEGANEMERVGQLPPANRRLARKERGILVEMPAGPLSNSRALVGPAPGPFQMQIYNCEIGPMEFHRLASGHLILFRRVWRGRQRYIQGVLIESEPFIRRLAEAEFRATALSRTTNLLISYQERVLAVVNGNPRPVAAPTDDDRRQILYRTSLPSPMQDLDLIFTFSRLPLGPGNGLVIWLACILGLVLSCGFLLMYRLGARQIQLANQQQDFVSAVSHELKTPLTSIRMYAEMLREGWVPEQKTGECYDFIHAESERLSRLISRVLDLARMTRGDGHTDGRTVTTKELDEAVKKGVASLAEQAGFELAWVNEIPPGANDVVWTDVDAFTQIAINLVDNAVKFSERAEKRQVDIGWELSGRRAVFKVRDYGPGIPTEHRKKIFGLFYRAENELTRHTVGTGIGLALVERLAHAMNASVGVVERNPGAEFRVSLPLDSAEERVFKRGEQNHVPAAKS